MKQKCFRTKKSTCMLAEEEAGEIVLTGKHFMFATIVLSFSTNVKETRLV